MLVAPRSLPRKPVLGSDGSSVFGASKLSSIRLHPRTSYEVRAQKAVPRMNSGRPFASLLTLPLLFFLLISTSGCAVAHLPTPTPRGLVLGLVEAEEQGLVQAQITGRNLDWIDLVLESLAPDPLEITIEIGTLFQAQSSGTQDMVVIAEKSVFLEAIGSVEGVVAQVACANMRLRIPDEEDSFTISRDPVPEDLLKLLGLPEFQEAGGFLRQFAVWTITDNPPRDGYRGLGYFGVGFPPDDEEIEEIRALFQKAGIPVENYQALR